MVRQLLLIVALATLVVTAACGSIAAADQGDEALVTETIMLKHESPNRVMMLLGLCSGKDAASEKDISCNSPEKLRATQEQTQNQAATSDSVPFLLPAGIESVSSDNSQRALVVTGTASGVEGFKKIVKLLDVPRKQVQIKTEVYQVKPGSASVLVPSQLPEGKKPEPNVLRIATTNPTYLKELKTQLENEGAQLHSCPIITAFNNDDAYIANSTIIPSSIGTAENGDTQKFIEVRSEIWVRSRVNGDGTITVNFKASIPRSDKSDLENAQQSKSPLTACFTVMSGGSIVLYEAPKEAEEWLLFVVTPTIVNDAPGQEVGVGIIN